MPGVRRLARVQLNDEVTAGTAVEATCIWRGPFAGLADETKVVFVPEDVGILPGTDRTYIPAKGASLDLPETEATFEQLPIILLGGVRSTSPTGTTWSKTWTFALPVTAANTIKTWTIEAGDDQQAERAGYGFVEEFHLRGATGGALMMSARWRLRQVAPQTFTAGVTLQDVEEIPFSKGVLYIDASGGTIGTTQKSNTLIDMALAVDTGLRAYTAADGQLYFSATKQIGPEVTLDITFEHDGTATAEKAAWRAETGRLIRLKWEGTDCGDAVNKKVQVDLAGKWESFEVLGERDGNDVVVGHFRARYSSTDSLFAQIVVINKLANVPPDWALKKDLSNESPIQYYVYSVAYGNGVWLAGTANDAQIWKSTNNGETWTLKKDLSDESPSQTRVTKIAYGNGVWLASTYPDAQIWKSSDDGETWTLKKDLSNESPAQTSVICVAYGNGVWLATTTPDAQIWKSSDDGETWTLKKDLSNESPAQSYAQVTAYGNGVWLVGTYPDAQIWKSSDDGETWILKKDLSDESPAQTDIYSVGYGNGIWLVGTEPNAQIWKSSDAGETWTLEKDLSDESPAQEHIYSTRYGNGVWLVGTRLGAQIWKSIDDGETWTLKKDLSNESPAQTYVFSLLYGGGTWLAGTGLDGQIWKSETGD
jgi:photosystem II stability/assembly factor-like uncharacterized protein